MSKLQRSSVSFRRQGSSGRIWDDPLRGLDLKGLSSSTTTTTTTPKAAPLHPDASLLAGDPSPRVVSRSLLMRHAGAGASSAGIIVESPDVVASASPSDAASVGVTRADGGERQERPKKLRRRISSAFCACMGHPPASHAQQ
ncbi:uncharacterized protein LOC100383748 [Zea mays]|jgi:hypothetical protein|uniref:Uncharacterized protein n=1 Tax=Zea mays TaxID=4577 RepID=C0PIS6_MAIZE|nr:uncharacterized protein LOC100383748 [Zea mays]ACN35092.1 unknown [Zea mays]ONM27528.1 hypothetical protein ZEAMMB73_Zm00001d007759 [Zea mays]|eukprot:NP_001169855.1 uncharacterized protein LOC100383748 [Zea mays]